MKLWILIATTVILLGYPGSLYCYSAEAKGSPSEAKVRKAIQVLISRPDSPAARTAGRVVLNFAGASPNYKVQISLCYLPWADSPDLPDGNQMLMAAFVAGNLQEQILKNSSRPEPYAGALAVIEVYQKMLRTRPDFKIPKVEEFIAMEKRGVLRSHIESLKP